MSSDKIVWIVGVVVIVLANVASGLVSGLLDRRPTCMYCGKRQRGATHIQWQRHMANIWEIRSDFWLCSRHSGRVVEYMGKLELIAERMNTAADRADHPTSSERTTDG